MRTDRILLGLAVVLLLGATFAPAGAQVEIPTWVCSADGTVDVALDQSTGLATWTVSGTGGCSNATDLIPSDRDPCPGCSANPPPFTLSGSGTSTAVAGICLGLTVTNLRIPVTLQVPYFVPDLPGGGYWDTFDENQIWRAPVAVFPAPTAFKVVDPDTHQTAGAGLWAPTGVPRCQSGKGHTKARFEVVFP